MYGSFTTEVVNNKSGKYNNIHETKINPAIVRFILSLLSSRSVSPSQQTTRRDNEQAAPPSKVKMTWVLNSLQQLRLVKRCVFSSVSTSVNKVVPPFVD